MSTTENSSNGLVMSKLKKEKKKEKSITEKLKDESYRSRVVHSCWLSISSFTLGIVFGQQGSTFLDLQIITGTDVESASFFFTAASCGYMFGSFISGFVHRKINNNVLMFVINAGAGISAIITPYASPYSLMIIMRFTTHVFCGGIDTLVNAEHQHIWGKDGRTLLQLIHFNFALGGVITPLFTEPFLAPKQYDTESNSTHGTVHPYLNGSNLTHGTVHPYLNGSNLTHGTVHPYLNGSNLTHGTVHPYLNGSNLTNLIVDLYLNNMTNNETASQPSRTTNVHYAFLISGVGAVIIALAYVFLIFLEKDPQAVSEKEAHANLRIRKLPKHVYTFVLLVLSFFYVVYCCIEDTFASFLMAFVVSEYESVSKTHGAYLSTFYWASFASGRFASIFVSRYLSAVRLVGVYSALMVVSYAGFTVVAAHAYIDAITVFACLAGISMSAVFPAGISWTEAELFKVTGWVSSCLLIGGSLGMMINPMIIGYLMKHVSNMWFCYILLAESFLLCAVFIFLLLFNRCYLNNKYGSIAQTFDMDILVSAPAEHQLLQELTPMLNGDVGGDVRGDVGGDVRGDVGGDARSDVGDVIGIV